MKTDSATRSRPLIYAHRGSTVLAPENSANAFDLALSLGSNILETDVRLSRDGQVIVTHDETLERTTDGRGKVASFTLQQLKQLDAGYHFIDLEGRSYRNDGIRLITLDELFERYPDTLINIDIKDDSEAAAEAVVATIAAGNRSASVTVGSFHSSVMQALRQQAPELRTAALKDEVVTLYFRHLMGRKPPSTSGYQILQIPCSYFGIPLATRSFVEHIHSLELEVSFWTVNDAARMRQLFTLGVDGMVTDRPDLAMQVFDSM